MGGLTVRKPQLAVHQLVVRGELSARASLMPTINICHRVARWLQGSRAICQETCVCKALMPVWCRISPVPLFYVGMCGKPTINGAGGHICGTQTCLTKSAGCAATQFPVDSKAGFTVARVWLGNVSEVPSPGMVGAAASEGQLCAHGVPASGSYAGYDDGMLMPL